MFSFKQAVAGARQRIGALFPRWGGGGFGRYSIVLPNSRYDYETQAGDLWLTPIIAIGIKWLGDRFPRPIFQVNRIGKNGKYTPYGQHALADLWNRPNEYYGRRTLEKAIGLSLICDGNAFVQKVRNYAGAVKELWWLPHDRVFPTWPQDGSEFIDGYRVRIDGFDWWLPKEDMIHIKDGIDPYNQRLGLSAVKAELREVCTVNEESGYTASILRNSGVPGMVIVPDDPSGKLRVTKEDAETIKARVRDSFGGERRGDSLVLQGQFKVQPLSFSPEQLALDKLPTHAIARIAAAMGVAPMSLGLPDAGKTYSNLGEANRASWGTIQATQELVAETLRYQLQPDFGLDPTKNTPGYDYSEIQEMQESLDAIWKRATEGYRGGLVQRGEGRDLLGLPQLPGDDCYFPGTGGTAEPVVTERIAVTEGQPVGQEGVTTDNGKPLPVTNGKPATTQNGKPVNRLLAVTNGKPKRWNVEFDSLKDLAADIDHLRNPVSDDGGLPSTTIIVAPEAVQESESEPEPEVKADEPTSEPEPEQPEDPWAGY
jgi:HK97 family phage portal protein